MLAALTLAAVAVVHTPACDPAHTFSQMRRVTGQARWYAVREIAAEGEISDSGSHGSFHLLVDTRRGRSVFTEDLGLDHSAYYYDGSTKWQQDFTYGIHPLDTADAKAGAITDAYLARHGYWSSATDPAHFVCLGIRVEDGRDYDVFRITPRGGRQVELWVDRKTHFLNRTIQQLPATVQTTQYNDYRNTDRLLLPYRISTITGDARREITMEVSNYAMHKAVANREYSRPNDPADWNLPNAIASVTVPIAVDRGIIYLDVRVNGKGPFSFIFDPGAPGTLTTHAAKILGISAQNGAIRKVTSLRIGQVAIDNLPFVVASSANTNSFPIRATGLPLTAGTVGPELLERFAIRLDYVGRTMTLMPLEKFQYHGVGVPVPFSFEEAAALVPVPLISAKADGNSGLFQLDYRDPGGMMLFQPFLIKHNFFTRYRDGIPVGKRGTGSIHASRQAMDSLAFAKFRFRRFYAYFSVGNKGLPSIRTEAGRIGYDVLSQFITTLDYRHEVAYFERRESAKPRVFSRIGIVTTKDATDSLKILRVYPNSPAAAANIYPKDRIVSVNGKPANISVAEFEKLSRGPVGASITLGIQNAGKTRVVPLKLADFICTSAEVAKISSQLTECTPFIETSSH